MVACQKRRLRRGRDLARVFRVLLRNEGRTGEGLLQLRLRAARDLPAVSIGGDCRSHDFSVPGGEQRPEDRLHDRPAQVTLQVRRPRGDARPLHRHRTGERGGGGSACEPDADADQGVAQADLPVGTALLPQQQHRLETEQAEDEAEQQREAGTPRLDESGRLRGDQHHEERGRQDREPGLKRGVALQVLQVLLADKQSTHQRAEHDDPGACRHPEGAAPDEMQVIERVLRPPLPHVEGQGDGGEAQHERSHVGPVREVDGQDERRHQQRYRHGQRRPDDQHPFALIAVAEGTEPEHGGGQAQREAHRHQDEGGQHDSPTLEAGRWNASLLVSYFS